MSDLISRQAAIDILDAFEVKIENGEPFAYSWARMRITELHSAQPERKRGKWTKDCACEICGFKPWYERDIHTLSFCPNCGADLREDQNDQSKR